MKTLMMTVALAALGSAFAQVPYKLGVAGYTFRQKTLDESLDLMQKADVHYLCVKDFHLKYTATDAEIAAFKAKCARFGVVPYALGPLYTKTNEEVRKYFEFARRFGAKVIVGVPYEPADEKDSWNTRKGSRQQLEYIDTLVKELDIRYAIHNHGPQAGQMFPDVAYGWNLVKDLDPRIGFCLDVGWEYGCGVNPAETIRKYGARIYDVHVKNFEVGKPNGEAIPLPRGKIDYVKVFSALAEVGYDGVCALEYEKDFDDNLAPIAESIGYARGVTDGLRPQAKLQPVPAGANTLTAQEKAEGYRLLFDGKDLPKDLWVGAFGEWNYEKFPERGWHVQDGALTMRPQHFIKDDGTWGDLPPEDMKLGGGGDICTRAKFRDFVFKFDFRMTRAANSGVKYFFDETQNNVTCEEYQILDGAHPDYRKGRDGNRQVAALYDLMPAPKAEEAVKPVGQWNRGMVISKGRHVEHWLNGVKVLEYERGSEEFRKLVDMSKYAKWGWDKEKNPQRWGELAEGRLLIQDHTDSVVSFCNLKVKEL